MARLRVKGLWLILVSLSLAACGEDSEDGGGTGGASSGGTGGAGTGGSTGGAGAGGAGGGRAGTGGGQAGSGGGAGGTPGGGTGGTPSGGTGGTPSGGTGGTPSGGTGGTPSGGGGAPSGGGGSGGTVSATSVVCGPLTCNLPQTFCCNFYNQPDQCMSPGATCGYGVDVACDGPEDCGSGKVCCGQLFIQGSNKSYQKLSCETSCTGNDHRVICGQSGTCAGNAKCGASEILPEYKDCK